MKRCNERKVSGGKANSCRSCSGPPWPAVIVLLLIATGVFLSSTTNTSVVYAGEEDEVCGADCQDDCEDYPNDGEVPGQDCNECDLGETITVIVNEAVKKIPHWVHNTYQGGHKNSQWANEPMDEPDWVDWDEPRLRDGRYQVRIMSGPYETREECNQNIRKEIEVAVNDFYRWYVEENGLDPSLPNRFPLRLNTRRIANRYMKETFETYVDSSVFGNQTPVTLAKLDFDSRFIETVADHTKQVYAANRTIKAGAGAGGLIAMMGVLFGLLRMQRSENWGPRLFATLLLAAGLIFSVLVGLALFYTNGYGPN